MLLLLPVDYFEHFKKSFKNTVTISVSNDLVTGSRSGPPVCVSLSGSKLFAKVIDQQMA